MKKNFSMRLKKAMSIKNIKASELSKKSNIPKSAISQYLSGLYEPKQESIFKLAKALGVSEAWLLGLNVPMTVVLNKSDELKLEIPILKSISSDNDYLSDENWIGTIYIDKELAKDKDLFALQLQDNNMFPIFLQNDILIIKKQNHFETGDIVVIIINNKVLFRRGVHNENGILLYSLNNKSDELSFSNNEITSIPIKIVGIVKQLKRKF